MKFFSLLLGVICLLESVMMPPVCNEHGDSGESISSVCSKHSCCSEESSNCGSGEHTSPDDCESACSPFQHCGCSKLGSNATLIVFLSLPEVFDSVVEREEIVYHERLPDSFLSLNHPPPKFS